MIFRTTDERIFDVYFTRPATPGGSLITTAILALRVKRAREKAGLERK